MFCIICLDKQVFVWGCLSGGVYVPCIYSYARWELLLAIQVFTVVFVWRLSSLCVDSFHHVLLYLCDILQALINSLVHWFFPPHCISSNTRGEKPQQFSPCLTCAVFPLHGVTPVPVFALCAAVTRCVVFTQQALAGEAVTGTWVRHVDVAAAAAGLAVATNLPGVAIVTRGTTVKFKSVSFRCCFFVLFFNLNKVVNS